LTCWYTLQIITFAAIFNYFLQVLVKIVLCQKLQVSACSAVAQEMAKVLSFGHMVEFKIVLNGIDVVYNYGAFDFNTLIL
jgi:hypothetical protein